MSFEDSLYGLLKAYKRLPYPIKWLLGKVYQLIPQRIKYGGFYSRYKQRIDFNVSFEHLLSEQLCIARRSIRYYKEKEFQKLSDFPVIDKAIVRSNFKDFCNSNYKNGLLANTGGSSGTPFEFYLEPGISRPKEKAHFDWYWGQFGYKDGDKILMVRGEALSDNRLFEYQPIGNKLALSCYLLNKSNIALVLKKIEKFAPKFVHGYPSALKNLIKIVEDSGNSLPSSILAIFLGSEGLQKKDRQYIKSRINARIVHWYGHSERLVHAGNCPYSDDFHIYPFYGFVELLDGDDEPITRPFVKGRVVATGYDNKVMPLIRYDTGDEAEYTDTDSCQCGFRGRSFKRIHGRKQDYIYLADKTKVSLTAFIFGQHFEEFTLIDEIQLEQEKFGELLVRIVLVAQKNFNISLFKEKLEDSVSGKLSVNLKICNNIQKTPTGKHIFLIQKINE